MPATVTDAPAENGTDTATAIGNLFLDAASTAQDAVLSLVQSFTAALKPLTDTVVDNLPETPFADAYPKPAETVAAAFSFAEKVLANQREFAGKLLESYGL